MPSRRSIELAERVLGRGLVRPALVLLSPSAAVNRATCFVFEGEEPDPTLVIHAMADPGRSAELATEMGRMERLRCELSGTDLNGTLPDPPLAVHRADGDVVVVEGFESRAAGGGVESRAAAWAWLARFQALLRGQARLVASAETAALLRRVEAAWVAAGSTDALPALLGALEALASAIVHVDIPRCAVHGDFWRGNISWANGRLRVYDWEWSSDTGLPTFDLWTYVLADLRLEHVGRHRRADRLVALTRELDRVATYLQQVGLPVELAALTAAPTLAELALRGEQRAGRPSDVAGDRWLFDAVSACVIRAASSRRATPVAAHPTRQELHV